jgi:hypothetical protein
MMKEVSVQMVHIVLEEATQQDQLLQTVLEMTVLGK